MKVALFVTEDWYVCSHRLPVIREATARGHEVYVLTHVEAHAEPITAAGGTVIPVDLDRSGVGPRGEARVLAQIAGALRRVRPDVLHNVALKPVIYGSGVGKVTRVPFIVNALAGLGSLFLDTEGLGRRALREALTRSLRLKNSIALVQNEDDREILIANGIARARTELIPGSGVNLAAFTPSAPPPEPPVRVLYLGRLLYDKGVADLYDAARLLRDQNPAVDVVMAGHADSHNPACIEQPKLDAWRAEGIVRLLGQQSDVPSLLRDAHIVVLPSYREGLPKALLEAAAAGRPMVATDVPGCREVVRPGVTGLLVPPRDPAQLAAAIGKLAGDQALRASMGAAARQMAEQEYSDAAAAQATVDLWERCAV